MATHRKEPQSRGTGCKLDFAFLHTHKKTERKNHVKKNISSIF